VFGFASGGGPVGLIAGEGDFPRLVAEAARDRGMKLVLASVERPAQDLREYGSVFYGDFRIDEGERLLGVLKEHGVRRVLMAGAVPKKKMIGGAFQPDALTSRVLAGLKEKGDDRILRAVSAVLGANGIRVMSPAGLLAERLVPRGVLTRRAPDAREERDVRLGLRIARELGRLDVGQAVVVKDGAVVAVEALEGTDEMLRRAGALGARGGVLVKVSKPGQDLRFDMPVTGPGTVDAAAAAGVTVLALEARKSLLLHREEAVARADAAGIAIVGV
jgi:hypothetical protein